MILQRPKSLALRVAMASSIFSRMNSLEAVYTFPVDGGQPGCIKAVANAPLFPSRRNTCLHSVDIHDRVAHASEGRNSCSVACIRQR